MLSTEVVILLEKYKLHAFVHALLCPVIYIYSVSVYKYVFEVYVKLGFCFALIILSFWRFL
jgi:hypothetical protein